MATITLRSVKGSPLLNSEVDANFNNLNTEKIERDGTIPMTKRLSLAASATIALGASLRIPDSGATPTTTENGDIWNASGQLKFFDGSVTADIIQSSTAAPTLSGDLTVTGTLTVNGATTTINSPTVLVADKNLTLNSVSVPTDILADGGGFTIKGSTDKTFVWTLGTTSFDVSENFNIATGKAYRIAGTSVLNATTLGAAVVASSLTSVGILTNLRTTSLGVGMAASGTGGRIDATNDVVAFSTSDSRLKMDVKTIEGALDAVKSLRGVLFTWDPAHKDAHGYTGTDTGVIAQDVIRVLPEVVTMRENGFLAVKYEKMVGLLIEAIKELDTKVENKTCTCNK